jgi:hypothetical protein
MEICAVSKLSTHSRKELHAYVLAHWEERKHFYAYVDELHVEATWIEMPAFSNKLR